MGRRRARFPRHPRLVERPLLHGKFAEIAPRLHTLVILASWNALFFMVNSPRSRRDACPTCLDPPPHPTLIFTTRPLQERVVGNYHVQASKALQTGKRGGKHSLEYETEEHFTGTVSPKLLF